MVTGDFPGGAGVGVVPAVDPESGRGARRELSLQLVLKQLSLMSECAGGCSGIENGVRVAFEEGDVPGDGLTEFFIIVSGGVWGRGVCYMHWKPSVDQMSNQWTLVLNGVG